MPHHTFRTIEGERAYADHLASGIDGDVCVLCARDGDIEFVHWKIIPAKFPYDLIAERHDMILPKRHCVEEELTMDEVKELHVLKSEYLFNEYDYLIEPARKSKPTHLHIHLIGAKPNKE